MSPDVNKQTPEVAIDELNLQIIRQLRDGRRSFGEIARDLGVTENTVRSRVKKLTDGGVLEIEGKVDPYKLPGHFLVMVGVKLKTVNLVEKGEEFSNLRGVISVAVVTGQYDLILTVLMNNEFTIKKFYLEEVSKIDDIQSTETWVIYHNVNTKIPYVL